MSKIIGVFRVTVFIYLFLGDICFAISESELMHSKENVFSMIDQGKFADAKLAFDKMTVTFAGQSKLSDSQYWIAERFERVGKFDNAKDIYRKIAANTAESVSDKAKLGLARSDIMSLIMSGQIDLSQKAMAKLAVDFDKNDDLPGSIFWITERYMRIGRYEIATQFYHQIAQNYPNSSWAQKAIFYAARAETMALVASQNFDKAQNAVAKLCVDYSGNHDLPEALYWIADKFEQAGNYELSKQNYQQIVQNFPTSLWAGKARLGVAKENAIAAISSKDFDTARSLIDGMFTEFDGSNELPEAVYWITEGYEHSNKFDDAKALYQKIINKFPKHPFANKAKLGIRRTDIMALVSLNDITSAQNALNKLIVDFNNEQELPRAVFLIGEKCLTDSNTPEQLRFSLAAFETILNRFPNNDVMADLYPKLYRYAGDCCSQIQQHDKALYYYRKAINDYPEDPFGWRALKMMIYNYNAMQNSGLISPSVAESMKTDAYNQILKKYPASPAARLAAKIIAKYNSLKGETK